MNNNNLDDVGGIHKDSERSIDQKKPEEQSPKIRYSIAKGLGAVISILFLPAGLLILVGDTDPDGTKHKPELLKGILIISIGALGLLLYGLGYDRINPIQNDIVRKRFGAVIVIGIIILVILAIMVHD